VRLIVGASPSSKNEADDDRSGEKPDARPAQPFYIGARTVAPKDDPSDGETQLQLRQPGRLRAQAARSIAIIRKEGHDVLADRDYRRVLAAARVS